MTEIITISILVLLITALLIMAIIKFSDIYKFIEETTNVRNKFFVKSEKELNHKLYNARKRDERLLREIHKVWKNTEYYHNDLNADHTIIVNLVKEVVKQCKGIDNVSRENSNCDKELKQLILSTRKSIKETKPILETSAKSLKDCTKILGLFEEIIKKSNRDETNS